MKTFAFILLVCLCGALAAPEKKPDDAKRDKRGYLHGAGYGYGYPAHSAYYGGDIGYAGYGGHLGYAGYGGHLGYSSYIAPAVATKVIAAPAVSYAAYPYAGYGGYYGGHHGHAYAAPYYAGHGAGWW